MLTNTTKEKETINYTVMGSMGGVIEKVAGRGRRDKTEEEMMSFYFN